MYAWLKISYAAEWEVPRASMISLHHERRSTDGKII
jgi:hypothetical protein